MWARSMSSLYRTCSMLQLESYCASGSLTASLLTCDIDYIGCPFSRESNIKCICPGVQVSASDCTNIPCWTVLIGVWISQPWSPPFCCAGWPGSTTLQNNMIQPKIFSCFQTNLVELTPFDNSWLISHWHSLSSVHVWKLLFCRVYETLAYHLRDSLGCKDCCANTNLLTYLPCWVNTKQDVR